MSVPAPATAGRDVGDQDRESRFTGLRAYVVDALASPTADPRTVLQVVASSLADMSQAGGTR